MPVVSLPSEKVPAPPSPNVDSAVIRIDLNQDGRLSPEEEKFFFRMVKSGFSQRRKTAANAFASLMDIPKERTYSALESLGLPLIALSRKLKNI